MTARHIKVLALGALIAIGFCIVFYSAYSVLLSARLVRQMGLESGVTASRIKPFLDGVVIDRMDFSNGLSFETVYMEAYPWEIWRGKIRHIYVEKAVIETESLFRSMIRWPFSHAIPLTIDDARIHASLLGKPVVLRAEFKQAPDIPLLANFKSVTPDITLNGKAEIRIDGLQVKNIDIEFQDAHIRTEKLMTRRGTGWLSLTQDTDWNLVGEIETGFTSIPHHEFFDTTFKLDGVIGAVGFSMRGMDQRNSKPWVIDREGDKVHLRFADQVKTIGFNGLDNGFLDKAGSVMTTFVLPQKKKPESAKTVLAQKPVKKTEKKPVIKHEKKAESPEKIAEPEIVAAEKPPEPVLLSDFAPLVRHSLYDGFHYSNRMAVVRHACKGAAIPGDNAVPECWEARGKGGVLSYNIHDPRALPPYFTKVTDYELSRKLRHYLGMVDIEILVLRGNRQGAQDMTIQGRDAQNNPLYIELSVSGLGE